MKVLQALFTIALIGLLLTPSMSMGHPGESQQASPTLAAIESAQESGRIGAPQALLYKLYAIYNSPKLPEEFRLEASIPLKCATPVISEIREQLSTMPDGVRLEGEAFFVRPTLGAFVDTAHFRVHYSTSGGNIIYNWPDTTYRDAVVASCEASWSFFHTTQGWPTPPSDGTSGGGNNLIDCYVDNLSGVYGVTYSESPVGGGHPNDYTAYFIIDNDYTGFGYPDRTLPAKVTIAHEYHHVVQMGLNASGASWFMENTSTFMEDEVYDSINDNYNYLNCYFAKPWTRLQTADGCFEYACFLWPTYLKERWGHSLVRDIWVEFADNTNLNTVMDNQLAAYGTGRNYDTAVAEWSRWNMYTYTRDDGAHYVEGPDYHVTINPDNDLNTYPQLDKHPSTTKMPQGHGANITRFRKQTGSSDNKLTITVDVLNACDYGHVIEFSRKLGTTWTEYEIPLDAAGHAVFEVHQWDQMNATTDYLLMGIPMKRACGSSGKDFVFDAVTSTVSDVADLNRPVRVIRLDQNNPNPFNPRTTIKYAISAPGHVQVDVFDASGRHVRNLIDRGLAAGEHEVNWFGDDDTGHAVATGLYFYTVRAGGETATRKMILVE
jgi:hypothetical protein